MRGCRPPTRQTKGWLARLYLNNGAYPLAIEAAQDSLRIVQNLGAAVTLATALVQVGRIDEGRRIMEQQKPYWPGFTLERHATVGLARQCRSSALLPELVRIHREAAAAIR